MKKKIYKIITVFLLSMFLLQSASGLIANAATLPATKSSVMYEAKFKLGTMYRHNTLVKSFFKFKMEVMNDESVKFSADGKYGDYGYVWSDRYEVKLYNKEGKERFSTIMDTWGDVYSGATHFINLLNSQNIKVGETLEIKSKYWGGTMHFPWDTNRYYKKSPMNDYMDGKLLSFLITKDGIIQQTPKTMVLEKNKYNAAFTLLVRNNKTGAEENRTININSYSTEDPDNGRLRHWLSMDSRNFGSAVGYSWADSYIILGENDDSIIDTGVRLKKGGSVSDGIREIVDAFRHFSSTIQEEYKLTFHSDNNTIRLYDKNSGKPCIFTNTNQNFENKWNRNRITFYNTKYGLMEE